MKRRGLLTFLALGLASHLYAQAPATASSSRAHVEMLASDRLDGRLTGSPGERLAGDYLVSELERIGVRPLPGTSGLRLPFEFTAGMRDGGTRLTLTDRRTKSDRAFQGAPDIRPLSFSDNGDVSAPVVFAGYGIVVPEGQGFAYDSYATLDVKDKIVLVLRYFPEDAETKTKAILSRYSDLRYKAMAARRLGAKGILVVTGPSSPNAGQLAPMTFDAALAGSGIAAASVSGTVADAMFATLGDPAKTLAAAQKSLDDANPHAAGFALPDVDVALHAEVVRERRTAQNIVGYVPATSRVAAPKPWVAVGAHYDHLGHGENGNTLADKSEINAIHHGADDNASGSAGVLAVAERIAAERVRDRHLLVAFWSGEELGLLGSSAFVEKPPVPVDQIAVYLNFDMIGRMQDNKLTVQAAGSSPVWARMLEQANVAAGFDLLVQQDPNQPTDVSSFNLAGVPSLNFFTGTHTDYHKPSDTADKINYEDLDRIVEFASAIALRVLKTTEPPAFTKFDQPTTGSRAGVRVFTGTIPDYSTEVKGLLLSGVIGGGPAEQAGLQKGDVIVEIAGQAITNIYDYTYALDVLKIGEPAKVVFMRDGTRRETTLVPGARR